MSRLLRVYEPADLGKDGYPHAWHRCPPCGGAGFEIEVVAAVHHPSCDIREEIQRSCEWCGGAGSIKDMIRTLNGGRCERCRHPYEHGDGEWSRCDVACRHRGPLRVGDLAVEDSPPGLWLDDGRPVEARWRILTVHHLTGDKTDCRWWNLAALCQRCHLAIQGRVNMAQVWPHEHSDWFRPHAAGYYAWTHLGEELGREETIARLDELLALEAVGR